MWQGYFTFDGTEIINASRVEAYAGDQPWFRPLYSNPSLPDMLEESYVSPSTDLAPWYDPDQPESGDFLGVYPLDITGLENSTASATATESVLGGGSPGRIRHGMGAAVFNVILPALSDAGLEYGIRWLKRALLGAQCSDSLTTENSLGAELTYLGSTPVVLDDIDLGGPQLLDTLTRRRRKVNVPVGPSVMARHELTCGAFVASVQFTISIGNAYEYGSARPTVQGFMDPSVTDPYVPGVPDGTFDDTGTEFVEVECPPDTWSPIYDPLCPALIAPPAPPSVPLGCYEPETTWTRRRFSLPAQVIPLWDTVVPVLTVYAEDEIRNLRVRFYRDPDGDFDPDEEPCSHIGDVVISYIPADGTFIFDAVDQVIYVVTTTGHRRRADNLAFRTDGTPFQWPELSCGYQHIVTFDLPEDVETLPVVALSLVPRAA